MTNREIIKSIIVKHGFILGLISVAMSSFLYTQNKHLEQNQSVGIISVLFILIAIILGIRTYARSNEISFGDGLKIGIGIAVFAATIITFYNYILMTYIDPDFINQIEEIQREAMENSGKLSTEQIEGRISKLKENANSLVGHAIGIVFTAFLGFVFSAITTVVFIKINESHKSS